MPCDAYIWRSRSSNCSSRAGPASSFSTSASRWRRVSTTSMASMTSSSGAGAAPARAPGMVLASGILLHHELLTLSRQLGQPALAVLHRLAYLLGVAGGLFTHLVDD